MVEGQYRDLNDYWGSPGADETLTLRKEVKACTKCDCTPLYWWNHNGRWLLHHHDPAENEMILHNCGFNIDGLPSSQFPWPKPYDGHRPSKTTQRKPKRGLFE
jgi:hypothetical protein